MEETVQDAYDLTSPNNLLSSQNLSASLIHQCSAIPWSISTAGDLLGMENGVFLSDADHELLKLVHESPRNVARKKPKRIDACIKKDCPPLITTWSSPRNKTEWMISRWCLNGRVILKMEKAPCRNCLEVKRANHHVVLNLVLPIEANPSHDYDQSGEKDEGKNKVKEVDKMDEFEFNEEELAKEEDQELEDSSEVEDDNVHYNEEIHEEEDKVHVKEMLSYEDEIDKDEIRDNFEDKIKSMPSRAVLASSLPTYLVRKQKKEDDRDSRMCISYVAPKMTKQSDLLGLETPTSKLVHTL